MTEQENVKVYELAKELGVDSISLLDKLKTLNIKVKNHMSELSTEEVSVARTALGKSTEAVKSVKKVVRTKKKPVETSGASAAPAESTPTDKKSASPIIRRRTKADGATETSIPHGKLNTHGVDETSALEATADLISNTASESDAPSEATSEIPDEAAVETQTTPSATHAPTADTPRPPIVFNRPVAPRKSFLKIVEAQAPPQRPVIKAAPSPVTPAKPPVKGVETKDKDGFRIIKMTKENLDQMVEEEAAKKRSAREADIRPEDVRFADYRKKEMVFLPKKKRLPVGKEIKRTALTQPKAQKRIVEVQDTISVQDLANQLSVKASDVIKKLMGMGQMATINQVLDFDTAALVVAEYKYEIKNVAFNEESLLGKVEDKAEDLVSRPPVVTIMGHVDHGKTTLLDSIREANVAAGEAGGITQHIGAYTVEKNGKLITFIDTPGHEAFTVMRARGANVTDIVILVVAADDGVMPQTREALSHAQAAKVPIIVAVNKIDKPGANPEKIKQGLAELNLLAEDWGGETMFVPVSALKKTNLDKLLDSVLLQAEVLDLKANPTPIASGVVLEARLEKGRGPVVSILVHRGTLRVGDGIVSGSIAGKIKAMMDDKGRTVKVVTPGIAAEVLGFESVPHAGESFNAVSSESAARVLAQVRLDKAKSKAASDRSKVTLEDLFAKIQAGETKELNVILKGDVYGSVEAIKESLVKLSNEKVKVKVIFSAPGGITESDVVLASASNAIVIGFNVRPETKARSLAEAEHVDIKCYSIIYELIDDIKNAMTGLLDKKKVEKYLGRAEVRQIFSIPKIGVIAGSSVIDGKFLRSANVRLLRDSRVIYDGKLSSLKRFKDDAKEVAQGFECGIGIENYNDLKPGDVIEAYQIDLVAPTMDA